MRYLSWSLIAFSFGLSLFAECAWKNSPEIISDPNSQDEKYLIFDEPDNQEFWMSTSIPKTPVLQKYWKWVAERALTTDPFMLLKRQREIFAKSTIPELQSEVLEFDKVLNKQVGTVRDASCIELLLFAEHAKHFEGGRVTHEFQAIILINENSRGVRIYFASAKKSSGTAPSLSLFNDAINRDLKQGFSMAYALHNHPFSFDNPYGDIAGTTIPSEADVASYITMKSESNLNKALVTNGISTIELKNTDFEKLKKTPMSSNLITKIKSWSPWELLAPLSSYCCCH